MTLLADVRGERLAQLAQVGGGALGGTDDDVADQHAGALGRAAGGERGHEQAALARPRRQRRRRLGRAAPVCAPMPSQGRATRPLASKASTTRVTVDVGHDDAVAARQRRRRDADHARPTASATGAPDRPS